jgi:hypothetical protein
VTDPLGAEGLRRSGGGFAFLVLRIEPGRYREEVAMKWVSDPTVTISKTELAQLLDDVIGELASRHSWDDEPQTELEARCRNMLVSLGSAE